MFEYTSDDLKERYMGNLAGLADLPTLVVAEAQPNGTNRTRAFLSRIDRVREAGKKIQFSYHHLSYPLISEEIMGSGFFYINTNSYEHGRTHWAVKEGNAIENTFSLLQSRARETGPPQLFGINEWPTPVPRQVAVMMPFESDFDPVYGAISRACKFQGLRSLRVDEIYKPTPIISDIFSIIAQSSLVISDLTGRNPNVLYETGIAHALGRQVIMIMQDQKDVPFDLKHIRFIKYLANREGISKLQEDLKRTLSETVH